MTSPPARRLVALRALGLGDFLTAVPALRALARAFPEHRRILVVSPRFAPLVDLLGEPWGLLAPRAALRLADRVPSPEVAVNLHGSGPASHRLLLRAGPERLIAFRHPAVPESALGPDWRREHEVSRWCRMLAAHGIACDPAELRLPPPPQVLPAALRGATVVHPGAASPARRWPPARWAAIARAEREAGRTVLLTGGPEERGLARAVARLAGLPAGAAVAGRTELGELAALVAAAGRVVCGDTGVAHLATAFGTPSVVLFGPTSPEEWGPPASEPRHRSLWRGRSGDPHGEMIDPGLREIDVESVLREIEALPA